MSKYKQTCLLQDMISNRIDVMVATEPELDNSRAFPQLLAEYEKTISPCLPGRKRGIVELHRKNLPLQVSPVFIYPDGWMVVLYMNYSGKSFRLLGIYTLKDVPTQCDFCERLEALLATPQAIVC